MEMGLSALSQRERLELSVCLGDRQGNRLRDVSDQSGSFYHSENSSVGVEMPRVKPAPAANLGKFLSLLL